MKIDAWREMYEAKPLPAPSRWWIVRAWNSIGEDGPVPAPDARPVSSNRLVRAWRHYQWLCRHPSGDNSDER